MTSQDDVVQEERRDGDGQQEQTLGDKAAAAALQTANNRRTSNSLASESRDTALSTALSAIDAISRKSSLTHFQSGPASPTSPTLSFSEDLARFPSESLHSFSFADQTSHSLHHRQNVLRRSIDFMRDKLAWAASSPRIASAQARLAGDEELLSMMELLQRANMMGMPTFDRLGLETQTASLGIGIGIGIGPLTGPAHMKDENVFDRSFMPSTAIVEEDVSDTTFMPSPATVEGKVLENRSVLSSPVAAEENVFDTSFMPSPAAVEERVSSRPQRASLKRTYTDVTRYSLHHQLTEAMAKPYRTNSPPRHAPTLPAQPLRSAMLNERAPHGHRNAQPQAIFTTEVTAPWTITAANDLACLVFGVTRAEVRKLGITEVIKPERRKWLEEKLRSPDVGGAQQATQPPKATPSQRPSLNGSLAVTSNGVTAKLLSKPSSRQSGYQSRRSKTENGTLTLPAPSKPTGMDHHRNKPRGVLLCGDVVPIKKMNGSTGSASLWVKEKGGNLIWVLEEVVEDVAYITVDEIGSVIRGTGNVESIWGMDRLRNGMDVQRLIPAFPKMKGTNTGALDYDEVARLRRFTARTANSISIPVTVNQLSGQSTFRVSSFPHIAGIMVLHPSSMRISSSNNVFSAALFGYAKPDGMSILDLIPGFDKILRVMTVEEKIALIDGIIIPEHSFRRARSLLALRDGAADAAAVFLRPAGLEARHRDGSKIMIDIQMRVLKSDRDPIYNEHVIEEEGVSSAGGDRGVGVYGGGGGDVVYALWITYSRQLHAVNHGIGPVASMVSRPGTPPQQPAPRPGTAGSVDPVPTPMVVSETGDEDIRISLLSQQLEAAKAAQGQINSGGTEMEPFEHPSPYMVDNGIKVIKKKRIDDFAILEEMGQGAYGQVKLARYKKAGAKKMVIKYVTKRRILVDTWHRDRRLGTVPLEIHVLDYLRREGMQHPNILEMADFFEDDVNYYIEMLPHGLPGMDLFDYIELRVTMDERECRKIFVQVAEAIRHLHVNAKVVHRDIKDENVVLDGEGRVKLVDFGSAAYIKSGPFDVFVGTIDYAAPEVLRGCPYRGKEQDVWALGILLYTIVYKENPFYSIDEIMDHDLRVPYVMSEDCIDLIRKMLDRDVERRIGIQGVVDHEWCLVDSDEDTVADAMAT